MLTLEEVDANLTWYKLNTNAQDPMYLKMQSLYDEMLTKARPAITHFLKYDFVVIDVNQVPTYGTYECPVARREDALVDGWFSCILFKLPFLLEQIQLGYLGFVFVIPIILISLFGGIKESYRWFILNQAIWDLFLCYDFICASPTLFGWFTDDYLAAKNACFYYLEKSPNKALVAVGRSFRDVLRLAPFVPVLLLTFSRFIAMYFSHFYRNFTKKSYKVLLFIIISNVLFILFVSFRTVILYIFNQVLLNAYDYCTQTLCPLNITAQCFQKIPSYFQCKNRALIEVPALQNLIIDWSLANYIPNAIPPLLAFFSNLFGGLLFWKIISQIKFQLKTNPESFKQTLKISCVVGFQCFFMSIIAVILSIQKYYYLHVSTNKIPDYNIYNTLPGWLFLLQYTTTTQSLNMIRIFLDSILILCVLSGYSSCVVKILKFAYLCLTKPKMAKKHLKIVFKQDSVTIIRSKNSRK